MTLPLRAARHVARFVATIFLQSALLLPHALGASNQTNSSNNDSSGSASGDGAIGVDVDLLFSTPEGRRGLDDMEIAPMIAACVAMGVGAVFCFAGARARRYAALGCAFFDGAFGTAAILERVLSHAKWQGVVSWTCFFLGGIFCCLLVVSFERADVLCLGVTAGLITAFTCLTTFGYLLAPSHPDTLLCALLVVFGVSTGLLTLKTQPVSLIPATSWIGSNMATWGIGYFFGDYPNGTTIKKFRRASDGKYDLPSAWWGYLTGAVVLFLLGTCVQAHTFHIERKSLSRNTNGRRAPAVPTTVLPHLDAAPDDDERRGPYASVQTPSRHTPPRPRSSSRPLSGRGFSHIV